MNKHAGYKETGIDWIKAIPNHWDISKSKYLFGNKSEKNHPNEPLLSVSQKDGVVLRSESDMKVWNPTGDVSAYKLIEPGNFVIGLRSFEGGLELSSVRGIVSPAYTVLETQKEIDSRYFRWLMKSHQFIVELNKNVTGIRQGKTIAWDDFSNIYLTVPPLAEQKLISRFLDGKTRGVDLLIKKIQRKIELLKEQRTALINQCVTKGLNPNVEMKDSGIEWIGQIPAHWEIKKLKYLVSYNTDTIAENTNPEYRFHYIEIGDVDYIEGIKIKEKITFKESPSRARRIVKSGDVIISTVRTYLRAIGVIPKIEDVICSTGFCVIRDKTGLIKQTFLSYAVKSEWFISDIISNSYGVSYPAINASELVEANMVVPPVKEQKKIVSFLEERGKIFVNHSAKLQKQIALLKEYRQSLISAAVTGKIRVTEEML